MTQRVTVHQTRTLSYDVTSALKRIFILRPFLSLCFVRFRHFENKAAEVERHKEKTHSHSPRKHLIANRNSRWKIPSEFQLISRKHTVQVCFSHAISISRTSNVKDMTISGNRNFRSAADGRMSVVFLVVMFMCSKPISGADEDIKSQVLEGHFRIKCEDMVSFMSNVWSEIYCQRTSSC